MVRLGDVDPPGSLQCVHGGEQPGLWSLGLASSAATYLLLAFPPRFPAALSASRCFPQLSRALTRCQEACPPRTTSLHSAIIPAPRAGPDTKKRLSTVFGGVPWGRMENAGQERPGTGSWGGRRHFQPWWRACGTRPPGLPLLPPPWAFLPRLQGCLKLPWVPALRQPHPWWEGVGILPCGSDTFLCGNFPILGTPLHRDTLATAMS